MSENDELTHRLANLEAVVEQLLATSAQEGGAQ